LLVVNGHSLQVIAADGKTLSSLAFPGGAAATPPTPEGILPLDFNFDFRYDMALAGAGGVRFFQQSRTGSFEDVTGKTKLPPAMLNAAYTGAWTGDFDQDGDLDIILGAVKGPPPVLRNNREGTWTLIQPFT